MYTPEENAQLNLYRAKCANGTITREELAQATTILRQKRMSAVQGAARKQKAEAAAQNVDSLLSSMEAA